MAGVDVSPRSVALAAATGCYREAVVGDLRHPPVPIAAHRHDGLVCVGVLTYLPDSAATFDEFARLLRPGAPLVVTQRTDRFEERAFGDFLEARAAAGALVDP